MSANIVYSCVSPRNYYQNKKSSREIIPNIKRKHLFSSDKQAISTENRQYSQRKYNSSFQKDSKMKQSFISQHESSSKSFYNNYNNWHIDKSYRISSQNRKFRRSQLSLTELKRYQTKGVQSTITSRQKQQQKIKLGQKLPAMPLNRSMTQKDLMRIRMHSHNQYKSNLLLGDNKKRIRINSDFLRRDIQEMNSRKHSLRKTWTSPHKTPPYSKSNPNNNNSLRSQRHSTPLSGNYDPTAIKVLNLDRLFRHRQGKLTNIIPIPTPKFNNVLSRQNMINTIGIKDRLHNLMDQFNAMLKIHRISKGNNHKIGFIKGHNFQKKPRLQDIIGLKLLPKTQPPKQEDEYVCFEIFINNCIYIPLFRKQYQLRKRIYMGICQNQKGLTLDGLTRLHNLFVSMQSSQEQKFKNIEKTQFRKILKDMCLQLPEILINQTNLASFSDNQKKEIFYQALIKVLLSTVEQNTELLYQNTIRAMFIANPQSIDIIIKLLLVQQPSKINRSNYLQYKNTQNFQ